MQTLNKKLNEIKNLKAKQTDGYFLNQNQLEKIKKDTEFSEELHLCPV